VDSDPTVEPHSETESGPGDKRPSLRQRFLRGNGHIIAAVLILAVFGADAISVSLAAESATARVIAQGRSEGLRNIQIEFEFEGERQVEWVYDDRELIEGDVIEVWFDPDDPGFVEFSRSDLFQGSYVIIGGALIYLAIAVFRRIRRRTPP
jgi:hypothetical protein